eukprot:CAMPEP_0184711096 /NCGR_PEP_ID=MMETSP0314-20130426/1803_1 /TAXON_ID=38298 /ORGANISM="Rhodella maculata, Strain CCMP 736" /LENGTH=53 /DNA_ID=CAMNT_0027173119 /DNA_START=219 /DNA_END=377 /DNA_ORIENTATION=+
MHAAALLCHRRRPPLPPPPPSSATAAAPATNPALFKTPSLSRQELTLHQTSPP